MTHVVQRWRLPTETETYRFLELIETAIRERRVVRVSFLKALTDDRGYPRFFSDSLDRVFGRRVMLTAQPVTRRVEPKEWKVSAGGNPYVKAVFLDGTRMEYPEIRTVRADRITALRVTREPFKVSGTRLDPEMRAVHGLPAWGRL